MQVEKDEVSAMPGIVEGSELERPLPEEGSVVQRRTHSRLSCISGSGLNIQRLGAATQPAPPRAPTTSGNGHYCGYSTGDEGDGSRACLPDALLLAR